MSNNHSSPPQTPSEEDSSATATPTGPQLHRSLSHSSHWSVADTPQHHHHGTSYFTRPVSPSPRQPPPILVRSTSATRRGTRSTSVSSSRATTRGFRDESSMLSEEDEESNGESNDSAERRPSRGKSIAAIEGVEEEEEDDQGEGSERDVDPITLKDRQSLINVEHPFGLPIWKPALYKKSRSVTRHADEALHSVPSAQAERHLLPGNIFWVIAFGWWLSVACMIFSVILYLVPRGGRRYSSFLYGLGWYLAWPFGKYVEGDVENLPLVYNDEEAPLHGNGNVNGARRRWSGDTDAQTIRGGYPSTLTGQQTSLANMYAIQTSEHPNISSGNTQTQHAQSVSWNPITIPEEVTPLMHSTLLRMPSKSYGTTIPHCSDELVNSLKEEGAHDFLGKACFWLAFICVIAPLMLLVCIACWGLVITIPMAKLNWALIKHILAQPTAIRFCAAPPAVVVSAQPEPTPGDTSDSFTSPPQFSVKHPRLAAGQAAPSGSPTSTVLLCTYRAVGLQYYKYTVGGVNIMFINLIPVVFFVIFDGMVLLPLVERLEGEGKHIPAILRLIGSRELVFILSLLSVIPLSYFIGMAVASISAQSSIGMGAVINATFGSIIEIILYSIALTTGKGRLVEGSIVGSFLAGVLLMPGMSMCSGAFRRKEQKFNAKSASVTSMMLIMAVIGTLTPTLFYQTYGNFQLDCSACSENPPVTPVLSQWICDQCYYKHPDPVLDPFYQSTVKSLMYFCAAVLLFSYLVGLWFSLRTHASQIWQNPQQLLHPMELPVHNRISLYHKLLPTGISNSNTHRDQQTLRRKPSTLTNIAGNDAQSSAQPPAPRPSEQSQQPDSAQRPHLQGSPTFARRVSYAAAPGPSQNASFTPLLESVDQAVKSTGLQTMQFPNTMTTDDFTRAVAVATVSALRHQQTQPQSPARIRASTEVEAGHGHDAPSWSRTTSASVLLACTALYAVIAELLVDVVDVILEGSGIDEKFLGITLFALVPNTTEFMNAISFALNGNIALSMEIGSAYALQVCLLQIPAMVAFSAWYAPEKMGKISNSFTLIFPRWDVVVIILSVFLMTYTYIEAKSNYHRGSILILSYLVLVAGFYYAPPQDLRSEPIGLEPFSILPVTRGLNFLFSSSK